MVKRDRRFSDNPVQLFGTVRKSLEESCANKRFLIGELPAGQRADCHTSALRDGFFRNFVLTAETGRPTNPDSFDA